MPRNLSLSALLLFACVPTAATAVETDPEPLADSRVHFLVSSGLLGCAWNDADAVFERAMPELGPALSRCADAVSAMGVTWTLWVDVGPSGEVERAWVPNAAASEDADARPPTCAMEALQGRRLESGPPSCGSVLMVRFLLSGE